MANSCLVSTIYRSIGAKTWFFYSPRMPCRIILKAVSRRSDQIIENVDPLIILQDFFTIQCQSNHFWALTRQDYNQQSCFCFQKPPLPTSTELSNNKSMKSSIYCLLFIIFSKFWLGVFVITSAAKRVRLPFINLNTFGLCAFNQSWDLVVGKCTLLLSDVRYDKGGDVQK